MGKEIVPTLFDRWSGAPMVKVSDRFMQKGFLFGDSGLHFKNESGLDYVIVKTRITQTVSIAYASLNRDRLIYQPVHGHIWSRAVYELISKYGGFE